MLLQVNHLQVFQVGQALLVRAQVQEVALAEVQAEAEALEDNYINKYFHYKYIKMVQKNNWARWVVLAVVVIVVLYGIITYNKLVSLSQNIEGKWSEVENQYQRQADLIPNLVSTVGSAVKVEVNFITAVTEARSRWQAASSQSEKDQAGVSMNNGIAALINAVAVSENYPTLQANKQYVSLTDELTGTQNRIAVARGNYISSIQLYNTATMRFPAVVFAKLFGYSQRNYYKAEVDSMQTDSLGSGQLS